MQKRGSILLSHTGLKYYYETNKKIFEELKRKYLSNKWTNSKHHKQIKEIAHNIRNSRSNKKIKQRVKYPNNQMNLINELGNIAYI